jgi:chromosome segregation ATPase
MSRDDVERRMRVADATLQQAAERLETTEKRLGELDQEREAVVGESETARRALTELEQAIADLREELASVELEEARQALADSVAERDATIEQTAAALDTAVVLLEQIDRLRRAVTEASERVAALDSQTPRGRAVAPEEPDTLHDPWQRLVTVVKDQLDEELETDIIDAAARSNAPYAINALPEHLRAVAMERRRKMQRAALDRLEKTQRR